MLSTLFAAGGILDPTQIIEKGGLFLVAGIIFAESGLLIGFFLPGDSLLFITGFLTSKPEGLPHIDVPLPVVLFVLFVAAFVGDQVGYLFGNKVGPALFDRPKSRLFNPANVVKAHHFFERHGPKTIVLARFVPIVRTFAPFLAGVAGMTYRKFLSFNVVGGIAWITSLCYAGYLFGNIPWVKEHLSLIVLTIVAVSVLPAATTFIKEWRSR